jgi:predicted ATPase
MSHDRITELRIAGLRSIEEIELDLSGLAVLIGDNGSGKSTILEALELLRLLGSPVSFVNDALLNHGQLEELLRWGADRLRLGVTIEGGGPVLDFDMAVAAVGKTPEIVEETLLVSPSGESGGQSARRVVERTAEGAWVEEDGAGSTSPSGEVSGTNFKITSDRSALVSMGARAPAEVERTLHALENIELQVPFEVRPFWQLNEQDVRRGPRGPAVVQPTKGLARYAVDLPNTMQKLRNLGTKTWERVIDRARRGIDEDIRDFVIESNLRSRLEIGMVHGRHPDRPLPLDFLSEGQLSYLCFLVLVELHRERSLLAFDEPESHLHPELLARVVWMLEEVAEQCPVVLATHSDRLLDALDDPSESVVLCSLDADRATVLRRPDSGRLAEWLEDYRGLGSLRAEGYEAYVFDAESEERPE